MCTGETVDQSNCVQLPRDIMCLPIGSMLLRTKILWMKHVVFWREPDGVIPRATGDWLTGRWDSRKVLRHCHNTWKTSTYARRCWSSRFWHSDWKSGLFPDFYRKYSKVRTFPGPGGQQLKIRTFPGNKDPWEPCTCHRTVQKQNALMLYIPVNIALDILGALLKINGAHRNIQVNLTGLALIYSI